MLRGCKVIPLVRVGESIDFEKLDSMVIHLAVAVKISIIVIGPGLTICRGHSHRQQPNYNFVE